MKRRNDCHGLLVFPQSPPALPWTDPHRNQAVLLRNLRQSFQLKVCLACRGATITHSPHYHTQGCHAGIKGTRLAPHEAQLDKLDFFYLTINAVVSVCAADLKKRFVDLATRLEPIYPGLTCRVALAHSQFIAFSSFSIHCFLIFLK